MRKAVLIFPFSIAGWILCGLIMAYTTEWFGFNMALILHATFGPLVFVAVFLWYFRLKETFSPFYAAILNTALVFLLDLVVVAGIMGVGFVMFQSFVATWLPFMLILLLTWSTGHFVKKGESETVPPVAPNLSHLS